MVAQVKFDVNRADKHIIQSIAILDTLDKDINTFAMRVREWCASGAIRERWSLGQGRLVRLVSL